MSLRWNRCRIWACATGTAWPIEHKMLEVMRQREEGRQLTGRIERDAADLGGGRHGGTAGRGSENKVSFVAALQTSDSGQAHLACFSKRALTRESLRDLISTSIVLPATVVSEWCPTARSALPSSRKWAWPMARGVGVSGGGFRGLVELLASDLDALRQRLQNLNAQAREPIVDGIVLLAHSPRGAGRNAMLECVLGWVVTSCRRTSHTALIAKQHDMNTVFGLDDLEIAEARCLARLKAGARSGAGLLSLVGMMFQVEPMSILGLALHFTLNLVASLVGPGTKRCRAAAVLDGPGLVKAGPGTPTR